MKHYRVIKAYGPWPKGHVFTGMQGNEARTLIARGLIAEVEAREAAKPKGKAMKSPADRMISAGQSVTRA